MPFTHRFHEYSPDYRESCFQIWVLHGRPAVSDLVKLLPVDSDDRKPAKELLGSWKQNYSWDLRADEIDAKALEKVDEDLVLAKADLFKVQYKNAGLIAEHALQAIASGTFDSSASAVNAYFRATEEQRTLSGISEFMQKVGKMSNEQIKNAITEKVLRYSGGDVIEGKVKEDESEEEREE